ncbi:MAG: nitroreductase [Oscillospiraceae bacterium]|nr:nitroreductase [Oscillospiraceae bacterium]
MSILDTIRARRSVRTFDGADLRAGDIEKIEECAKSASNPYSIPIEWRILSAGDGLSSPVIVGAQRFIAGKMRRTEHAEEAFGYSFEKIVLLCEELGVGTTIIAGTMDRGAFERAMGLESGEVMPCMSPLGYPAKKMSIREGMMRAGIKADTRLSFGEIFFDGAFDKPLADGGAISDALEAVRLAPSAVNKQPWRVVIEENAAHFYIKHARGYGAGTGWDMQKIDLGIALCHFELAMREMGFEPRFELGEPGVSAPEGVDYIASFRW